MLPVARIALGIPFHRVSVLTENLALAGDVDMPSVPDILLNAGAQPNRAIEHFGWFQSTGHPSAAATHVGSARSSRPPPAIARP
jgi:hypothetical protein